MQDIFISALPALLDSWAEAFPKATLFNAVPESIASPKPKVSNTPTTIFWLHINDDKSWLANTMVLIAKEHVGAKVVVLANMPSQPEAVQVLGLGAMGYCHAYMASAVLKEIRSVVSHGGLWLGQDLLQRLIEVSTSRIGNQPEYVEGLLAKLTNREKEVAMEAAKGLSNKEIARVLSITERTVKAHLAHTFERLGAKDRLQLALMLNDNYKH
ncbi:MAG: response regulator transcription factor [Sulfuritalea sp.]|nr:response regulator transcription factor [Sulfuritalea sp.]